MLNERPPPPTVVGLRHILQTYPEICIFCVLQKIVPQKQSAKGDLKMPGKSCDEIHIIVNLGQNMKVTWENIIRYIIFHMIFTLQITYFVHKF